MSPIPFLMGSIEESKKKLFTFISFLNSLNFEIAGLPLSRMWEDGPRLSPAISKSHLNMSVAF